MSAFDAISVRDSNSGNIVHKLTGKEPVYNLDPVLAYDYMGKCSIPDISSDEKYLILYGYSGRFTENECSEIKKYAVKHKLKIYCIGGVQNVCDKFIDCEPFKVISCFKNAECIITDTFHGTIMSVITHSNFVSFVRSSGYGNTEKLTDLLSRLDLKNRIINNISELESMLDTKFDYDVTDKIISEEREKTYSYLKNQIGEIDGK